MPWRAGFGRELFRRFDVTSLLRFTVIVMAVVLVYGGYERARELLPSPISVLSFKKTEGRQEISITYVVSKPVRSAMVSVSFTEQAGRDIEGPDRCVYTIGEADFLPPDDEFDVGTTPQTLTFAAPDNIEPCTSREGYDATLTIRPGGEKPNVTFWPESSWRDPATRIRPEPLSLE